MDKHCSEHSSLDRNCKECYKAYQRWHYRENKEEYKRKHAEWYQANKHKHKDKTTANHRKRNYGVDAELFDTILRGQGGCCAICKTSLDNQKKCLDHCHGSGTVRGILCSKCNMALGLFKDDWHILSSAMTYLERFK